MKDINILAIQTGHNTSCALLRNGEIIGIVSEERFTRVKNYIGFPVQSIEWLLKYGNISAQDLDAVAICGYTVFGREFFDENKPTKSKGIGSIIQNMYGKAEYHGGPLYRPLFNLKFKLVEHRDNIKQRTDLMKLLESRFHIKKSQVQYVEHHTCHVYSAYYGQTEKKEDAAILTLDGEGDTCSSTVNTIINGNMKRIASSWRHHSLGYIYSNTTTFMGMKALEHEYKVMGLAPYAATKDKKYFMDIYNKAFKDVISLDKNNPLKFVSKFPTNRFGYWLRKKAVGERFDNVAGAVQHLTEKVASQWVKNVVDKTNISNIYAGGGVFMNVKMNMILAKLKEVKKLNILPSCGDESNPIGAAYYLYLKLCKERGLRPQTKRIKDIYLGPDYDDEVADYINQNKLEKKFRIRKLDPNQVAKMIARGEVVARSSGRMEWGARSLGNRCIMANPTDLKHVWEINDQIKMRDFWMPFAPSILKERQHDYIDNPKNLEAPYMIMAFDSTELGKKELRAAMHQADFTLRPQLLEESWNPKYYKIIKEFENVTGIGGILNTSFNLHGKPIVATPKDAVEETFVKSGLKHLILGDYLISKN